MSTKRNTGLFGRVDAESPGYYIKPTRDFTQFTRDCEQKYWSSETAFDWEQDVHKNVCTYLMSRLPRNAETKVIKNN